VGRDWDLRLGRYQTALAAVREVDAVIVDAPYGERTHGGHDDGVEATRFRPEDERRMRTDRRTGAAYAVGVNRRQAITYTHWTSDDVYEFVISWSPRCAGWFCAMTSHDLVPYWMTALDKCGRYAFAPLPVVETGSRVRLTGDGPSSWTCWLVVARPKSRDFQRWGTLPGAYIGTGRGDRIHIGGKDSEIMRRIVRDYSRPGDLVCDPCAGGGTTLLAAVMEGRRAIGAEMDAATHAKALARLQRGYTPPLFVEERPRMVQTSLLGGDG
jgi:hypothetical protein